MLSVYELLNLFFANGVLVSRKQEVVILTTFGFCDIGHRSSHFEFALWSMIYVIYSYINMKY